MADNSTTQKKEEQPLSIADRLVESSIKAAEKRTADKTNAMLDSGANPLEIITQLVNSVGKQNLKSEDVLKQVTDLAGTQVPSGESIGILKSLMSGGGVFNRAEGTEDLGIDDAVKVMQLQQQQQATQGKIPQQQVDLLNSLIDLSGKVSKFQAEGETIERDITGQLTTKGIKQTKEASVKATKEAEDAIKKEQLKKDLGVYFEIGELIPTGEGLERFKVGMENFAQSITQKTPVGVASERLKSMNKRLRVTLVRAAGDVGNLNIVEQAAAEQLLYKLDDSTQTRALKKAVLQDLTRAIKDKNTTRVKMLINTWMNTTDFQNIGKPKGTQSQWSKDKEARYQELLKKRGK